VGDGGGSCAGDGAADGFMVHTLCDIILWRVHRTRTIGYRSDVVVRTQEDMGTMSSPPVAIVVLVAVPGCAMFVPTKT